MSSLINQRNSTKETIATSTSSSNKFGLDSVFQHGGKRLKVGEKFSVKIYKGKSVTTGADPVDAKASATKFPLIAKFPSSVVRPDFTKHPWNTGRLYQQDVPQIQPDSDEEDENNDENGGTKKRRWRYYNKRQQDGSNQPRQWILQEEVDFLETMVSKREQRNVNGKNSNSDDDGNNNTKDASGVSKRSKVSSRYEGIPESSTSHYALVRVDRTTGNVTVQVLPANVSTITFQQPSARKSLSLNQAEQVIQDQRMGLRSTVLLERTDRDKIKKEQLTGGGDTAMDGTSDMSNSASKKPLLGGGFRSPSAIRAAALKSSKGRLLRKFKDIDKDELNIDEGDDVMGDVTFRNRKGGGAARRELLTSLGDGLNVTDDGVVGGSNDTAFAGKQKFGNLQLENNGNENAGGTDRGDNERGADGAAMADDFYTRDVGAEYEELDYDANDQFDDDDVDLGEGELTMDGSNNFGGEDDDIDDGESSEDDDDEDSNIGGAEGLASVAGFKALLAKARGEAIPHLQQGADGNSGSASSSTPADGTLSGSNDGTSNSNNAINAKKNSMSPENIKKEQKRKKDELANDHFSKIVAAAEKANAKMQQQHGGNSHGLTDSKSGQNDNENDDGTLSNHGAMSSSSTSMPTTSSTSTATNTSAIPVAGGIKVDENGLRLITLKAVQNEIWLNHGSITTKRLMKIFDVKKKSTELRQSQFRDIVKELCTMKTDPIKGRMLVLKQHYSNM